MWFPVFFWWLGLASQLIGVGIALWGLAKNEDAYMPDGKRSMLRIARETPGRVAASAKRTWNATVDRITGRRSATVHAVAATAVAEAAPATPSGMTSWSDASPNASLEERLALVETRLRALHQTVESARDDASKAAAKHDDLVSKVKRQADELRQHADESVGKLATKGVRFAAFGLALTAVGMLLSAFGASPLPW